jgi:hypothetical protein
VSLLSGIPEGQDAYSVIYAKLTPLKVLAQEKHIAIVAVMHKNKSGGNNGDPLDGIYGNTAYGAVADNILLLDRKSATDKTRWLSTYGKYISENTFPLDYADNTGRYAYAEGARKEEVLEKGVSRQLAQIVKDHPGITGKELQKLLNLGEDALYKRTSRAKKDGAICTDPDKPGYYPCPDTDLAETLAEIARKSAIIHAGQPSL